MRGRKSKVRKGYFIKIPQSKPIPVTSEVYRCWYALKRKEKAQKENDRKHNLISLEELTEKMGDRVPENQHEDLSNNQARWIFPEQQAERDFEYGRLYQELNRLTQEEQSLLFGLFYECISLQELSKRKGIPRTTLRRQRDRILSKLAKMLEDIE